MRSQPARRDLLLWSRCRFLLRCLVDHDSGTTKNKDRPPSPVDSRALRGFRQWLPRSGAGETLVPGGSIRRGYRSLSLCLMILKPFPRSVLSFQQFRFR